MGILNVTPDSFSDGGKWDAPECARLHAIELSEQGAGIIDMGAESTRPGAEPVPEETELARLIPALEAALGSVDRPVSVDTIVVSTQHTKDITQEELRNLIIEKVITPVIDPAMIDENTKYLINPSGSFIVGGSWGDSGTTGRKIVVDTYGGYAPIGGGCFSSKDPTKVDRSAAYYARYVCRNIVANGLAERCQLQLSYAIGKADPVSVYVQSFGTSSYTDEELEQIVLKNFCFRVSSMIDELDLCRPIYRKTTNYGHFGKKDLPWEQFKKIEL